jgi:hypothetical protein
MSEANRVFPRQDKPGAQTASVERRFIVSAPRRSGFGSGKSRVVEVVQVRRNRPRPIEDRPRPAPWSVRAETWPEGFRATSAVPLPQQDVQPVAPEPAQPTVHVMPMWEPSPPQPAQPVVEPAEPPVETAVVESCKPRTSKPKTPKARARRFADPFADEDSGANCVRCGYLVEQAREKRGLMTCSTCG